VRASRAHSDRKPATEVQQCPLRAEIGEELGEELARRKWTWKWRRWTWKWMQMGWRKRRRRRRKRTNLIKFNNSHLAGGESTSNFFTKKLIIKLYPIYNIVPILKSNKIYLIRKNDDIFKIIISN
jgi:hypothetical protein